MKKAVLSFNPQYFSMAVAAVLLFAALLPAPAVHAQELQDIAVYQKADRQEKLAEGAKKEGTLLLYTAMPREYVNQLNEPFEKKYGIKVQVWRSRGESILQRVINEDRASPSVDVIHSTGQVLEAMSREGILAEIRSPMHKDLIPAAVPAHHQYASDLQYVFVQAYNTTKVQRDELPKSYHDLLDPKWKGRLGIEASDHEWVDSVISDMGAAKGVQLFKSLVKDNALSMRQGHPLLTELVVAGEVPLALTVYQYSVEQAKKAGAPVDWFAIEPAVSIQSGMGVPKKAPHPHAAVLYYDYMLSPQAQAILAKIGYVPTSVKVESPLKGVSLKYLDAAKLLDNQEKSEAQFHAITSVERK